MASVLVSAAHVSVSVLVSEVPALSTGSREPASVSRPASRRNLDGLGLGLGLGQPCLGLGLGGPGLDYNPGIHSIICSTLSTHLTQKCPFLQPIFQLHFLQKCVLHGHTWDIDRSSCSARGPRLAPARRKSTC